ncbi:MAG: D-alanine--D-alanine ligase family protein [Thermoanaerobaculia bacterium]
MSAARQRVGVVFGGASREHGVSFSSARCLLDNLPKDRYEALPLFVGKNGVWHDPETSWQEMTRQFARPARDLLLEGIEPGSSAAPPSVAVDSFVKAFRAARPDVLFPIVHGTNGEDGVLQGLFEAFGIPYVGFGVAASAAGMDKILMKAVFGTAGLPQVHYHSLSRADWHSVGRRHMMEERLEMMPLPLFVKPACAGSSVGVTKVKKYEDLPRALQTALLIDERAIVEEGIDAREIECSVLEGEDGERNLASTPGEIIPGNEFYDYEDKYIGDRSKSVIPADLSHDLQEEIRTLAVAAFDALGGAGFARVDFFLERGTNRIFLNELNSLPGFTPISMFPKMWEASGMPLPTLLDRLVKSAFQRPARGR